MAIDWGQIADVAKNILPYTNPVTAVFDINRRFGDYLANSGSAIQPPTSSSGSGFSGGYQGSYNQRMADAIRRRTGQAPAVSSNPDIASLQEWMQNTGINPGMLDSLQSQLMSAGPGINPTDMTDAWTQAARAAYNPQIGQLRAGIGKIKNEGKAAKGETRKLYNVAENTYAKDADELAATGQADAKTQTDNTAALVAAMDAANDTTQRDYVSELEGLGYGDTAGSGIQEVGDRYEGAVGTKGGLTSNRIAETTSNASSVLDQLSSQQDSLAAAAVTDISNQVADLVFQQRGLIADAQAKRAAAELSAMMQARSDYMQQQEMAFSQSRANRSDLMGLLGMRMEIGDRYQDFYNQSIPEAPEPTDEQARFNAIGDFAETKGKSEQDAQRAIDWAYRNFQNAARVAEGYNWDPYTSAVADGVDPQLAMYAAQQLGIL